MPGFIRALMVWICCHSMPLPERFDMKDKYGGETSKNQQKLLIYCREASQFPYLTLEGHFSSSVLLFWSALVGGGGKGFPLGEKGQVSL